MPCPALPYPVPSNYGGIRNIAAQDPGERQSGGRALGDFTRFQNPDGTSSGLGLPIGSALRPLGLMQKIWIGEAPPEVRCRPLTLRKRGEATVDVGSTPFNHLNANRVIGIVGLGMRGRDGQHRSNRQNHTIQFDAH